MDSFGWHLRAKIGVAGVAIAMLGAVACGGGSPMGPGEETASASAGLSGPPAPTGLTPAAGSTVSTSQVFTWIASTGATKYRFWINEVADQTYTAAALGCSSSSTCTTPAVALGAGTSGYWYVEAEDDSGDGNWTAAVSYTVAGTPPPSAPTGLTPSSGATISTSQEFSWSASTGAAQYRFWISGVADQTYSAGALGCSSGSTCTTPAIGLVAGTNGNWYVEAEDAAGNGNWTNAVSYTVAGSPPPAAPVGLAPASGSTVTTSQAFSWAASTGATQYRFWISGVADNLYSSAALGCSFSSTCITPAITLATGTTGDWYVEAQNSSGAGNWTAAVAYTVAGTAPPAAPTIFTPASGATVATTQVFAWTASTNATQYRFWISGVADQIYAASVLGCSSSSTCTTPSIPLVAGTTGYWYVEAQNSAGDGNWSAGLSYTVAGTPPPLAPTGLSPAAGSTVSTSQVFSWSASTGATQYRFWINGVIDQTYAASALGCSSSPTCTTPTVTLGTGTSGSWYVEAENAAGNGNWTAGISYTVAGTPPPAAPTGLTPGAGSTVSTAQVFSWVASTSATQYRFWINDVADQTYSATTLGCASTSACATPPVALATGTTGYWYVEAENASGEGNWTAGVSYTVGSSGQGVTTLAAGLPPPLYGLAVDGTNVYFSDNGNGPTGSVLLCGINGCNETPTTLASNQVVPEGVAAAGGSVYWATAGSTAQSTLGGVMKCPIAGCGTGPTILASGYGFSQLAADSNNVYWIAGQYYNGTSWTNATVQRCAVTGCGGNPTTLYSLNGTISGLAIDAVNVYWATGTAVMQCSINGCGGNPTTVFSESFAPANSAAVASDGTNVYWSNYSAGTVKTCPVGGCSTPTIMASGQNYPVSMAVDSSFIYWESVGAETVVACAIGGCGGNPTILVTNATSPAGLVLDATSVYFTIQAPPLDGVQGLAAVLKTAKP